MKNYLKFMTFALVAGVFASCSEDTDLPPIANPVFSEIIDRPDGEPVFDFETDGQPWTNFAEAGSEVWFLDDFGGNYYLEFSSFGSGESSNIGWLISPPINIDAATKKRLIFQSAQHHATNAGNTFDLLVSEDFDGTDVLGATWTVLNFNKPEYTSATNYDWVNSGGVSLANYSGTIHIAFRVKGNGLSNSDFDGGFEVDNIKVF